MKTASILIFGFVLGICINILLTPNPPPQVIPEPVPVVTAVPTPTPIPVITTTAPATPHRGEWMWTEKGTLDQRPKKK